MLFPPPSPSDHEDSTRYVKLLHTVFDQSLVFRDWLQFTESETGAAVQGDNSWPANKAAIEEHLLKISEFFYCVICNMVIRGQKETVAPAHTRGGGRRPRRRTAWHSRWRRRSVLHSGTMCVIASLTVVVFSFSLLVGVCLSDLKSVLKRYIKHCMRTLVSH